MTKKTKLFDYHLQALAHGKNKPVLIDETIQSAIKKGLSSICFTDHFPLPKVFDDPTSDIRVKFPNYVWKVQEAQKNFKNRIEVFLGTEFDWLPQFKNWISRQI